MSDRRRAEPLSQSGPLLGPDGGPVLVLGNSLGTSAQVWDGPAAALSRHFRLLRYELPGHGGSAAWSGSYTVADLGRAVVALLDSSGVERAGYCGISLGGMVGLWLAANAPERVAALGIICSSAYLPPAGAWRDRAARVRASGLASVSAQVVSRWFTPAFAARAPGVVSAFLAGLEQTSPDGYAGCCEAIADMDLRADLAAIRAPALVLVGGQDPATPPEHGAVMASGIAGARLETIPQAAHLATVSEPDLVARLLSRHLLAAAANDAAWGGGRYHAL